MNKLKKYPSHCCSDCGNKYGTPNTGTSTFHKNKCEICNKITSVTETRDYGYPDFPRFKKYKRVKNPFIDV